MNPFITGLSMKFSFVHSCVVDEYPEEDIPPDDDELYELELFSSLPLMYKTPTPHPTDTYLK